MHIAPQLHAYAIGKLWGVDQTKFLFVVYISSCLCYVVCLCESASFADVFKLRNETMKIRTNA